MKRFIRYLYEYEQGRRLRNVGFVKVEQGEDECTLHIHGKGLHMKGGRKLELYLFYGEDECVGIWQGIVDNVNPAVNYRLYFTREDVVVPENFDKINGIILESEQGHKYAAVWNEGTVNVGRMRVLRPDSARDGQEPEDETAQAAPREEMQDGAVQAAPREEMQDESAEPFQEEPQGGGRELPFQEELQGGNTEAILPERMPEMSERPGEAAFREELQSGDTESVLPDEIPGRDGGMLPREELQGGDTQAASPEGMTERRREADDRPKENKGHSEEEDIARGRTEGAQRQDVIRDGEGNLHKQEIKQMRREGRRQQKPGSATPDNSMGSQTEEDRSCAAQRHVCSDQKDQQADNHFRCTKIQRNELAVLPRCEWKWANNSFLLHGYYNYRHLAFIDDGEKFRLGVPGIYHPQEAKAASTFGFTEFIPKRDIGIDLSEDEKSDEEQFGYWCRPIKRPLKM